VRPRRPIFARPVAGIVPRRVDEPPGGFPAAFDWPPRSIGRRAAARPDSRGAMSRRVAEIHVCNSQATGRRTNYRDVFFLVTGITSLLLLMLLELLLVLMFLV